MPIIDPDSPFELYEKYCLQIAIDTIAAPTKEILPSRLTLHRQRFDKIERHSQSYGEDRPGD